MARGVDLAQLVITARHLAAMIIKLLLPLAVLEAVATRLMHDHHRDDHADI